MRRSLLLLLLLLLGGLAALWLLVLEPGGGPDGSAGLDSQGPETRAAAPPIQGGPGSAPDRAALQDPGQLLVRILDPSGAPAEEGEIFLQRDGQAAILPVEAGSLTLPRPATRLRLAARAAGRWSELRTLAGRDLATRQEVVLQVEELGAELDLQAHHADGRPLASFTATLAWAAEEGRGAGDDSRVWLYRECLGHLEGRDGRVVFAGMPAGSFTVRVESGAEASASASAKLPPGGRETLVLELHPGAFVSGWVQDGSGQGLAGATVYLRDLESLYGREESMPVEYWLARATGGQRAVTAPDGRFRLGPASAGLYRLGVHAAGHPEYTRPEEFQLEPGAEKDLGAVTLPQGRRIVVRVLRATDRQPVAGARVSYVSEVTRNSIFGAFQGWKKPPEPLSGEDGRVALEGLGAGTWIVRAEAAGLAPREGRVDLDAEEARLDLVLDPELCLAGSVVDSAGQPVAGAEVTAKERGEANLWEDFIPAGVLGDAPHRGLTDEDGRFELEGLSAGTWRLAVRAEDFAPASDGPVLLDYGTPPADRRIRLSRGGTVRILALDEAGLPKPATVVALYGFGIADARSGQTDEAGRAEFLHLAPGIYMVSAMSLGFEQQMQLQEADPLSDFTQEIESVTIEDEDVVEVTLGGMVDRALVEGFITRGGEPVEGVMVMLYSSGFQKFMSTEEDGYYRFEGIPAGEYMFLAGRYRPGGGSGWTGSLRVRGSGTVRRDVELPGSTITVVVRDADTAAPLSQVPVLLRRYDGSQQGGGYLTTDARGLCTFLYVQPGDYMVSAGYAAMPFFGSGTKHATKLTGPIHVAEGSSLEERIEMDLQAAATLKGRVLDNRGDPVTDAGVFFLDPGGQPISQFNLKGSKADGGFELVSLPPGRGRVLARHREYGQIEEEVFLTAGETTEIDLVLDTGTLVHVLITGSDEKLRSGVQAVLVDVRGVPISQFFTGMEGMMSAIAFLQGGEQVLGPVPAGRYTVVLTQPGGPQVRHELEIPPGTPELHLTLPFDPEEQE